MKQIKQLGHAFKNPSARQLGGEAFWVAFGIGISTIGTFAGVRLLTSVMSPDEYGKLALAVSVALGLVYSLGAGGGGSIVRFFPIARQEGKSAWYWKAVRQSLLAVVAVTAGLVLILAGAVPVFRLTLEQAFFWGLTILFGGAWTAHTLGYSLHTGARRRKTVSWHQCVMEWGRFLAAFGLIFVWENSASAVLAGFLMVTVLVSVSEWMWARKRIFPDWTEGLSSADRSADFFRYFRPLVLSGFFFWLQMFADRWALKTFCSLKDVGIYFALYQIAYAPMIYFSTFLSGFLGPVFYGKAGDGGNADQTRQTLVINEKIALFLLGIVIAGVIAAFWIGQPVCTLLIDGEYSAGFWAFPWILASGGIYAVAQQLLLSVYSGMSTRITVPLRAAAAVLSLGCYMAGAFLRGFAGAVIGGFIFAVVFFSMTAAVHISRKRSAGPPDPEERSGLLHDLC